MVFTPPAWVPQLPFDPPDSITVAEFMRDEKYGRYPIAKSRHPYTCALTGKSYSAAEVIEREDHLARGISRALGFSPREGSEWEKVVGLYSLNTIDYIPLTHAIHRLNGIVTPSSALYSAAELEHQLRSSGAKALKAVMISHRNIIANIMQKTAFESIPRKAQNIVTQVVVGFLPFSHIYGLVLITHVGSYRGDQIIVQPRFELKAFLAAVARFRIEQLNVVPPILIQLLNNKGECRRHDLSSVRFVYTGAAPLGGETVDDILNMYPTWRIGQGYGLTETATVVTSTSELDILQGSVGSLVPHTRAKLLDPEGNEITDYDTPGELYLQSPSVVLGYLNNERASAETFIWDNDGRWIRTGDEVLVRKSPAGNEHFVVVDRIKELIKVNGHQVAPAELEAHILSHPTVMDCAVIQVPDARAGEVPKAFIVKAPDVGKMDEEVEKEVHAYVQEHKARHKWLKGGIQFIEKVPKSPTGKILRRLLRDQERKARGAEKAKL
ncbi:hypothetical protein ACJ41O_003599 [Fusarium nematophilum]